MPHTVTRNREIANFLHRLRAARHSALLLDYDGTLAPFTVERRTAVPYPGVRAVLQDICDTHRTRIVIVSGRSAADIQPLLQLHPAPEVWGSHGFQRLRPNDGSETPRLSSRVSAALANAQRWLAYQGLHDRAEPKPGSLAVHWRGLDETSATALREKVLLGWSPLTRNYPFSILEFDGGLELRVADYDKGRAVRTILKEIARDTPVAYLGDDRTDEPAFRALHDRGLTVLVRKNPRPTLAQAWLRSPGELLEFLDLWRRALLASAVDGISSETHSQVNSLRPAYPRSSAS